MKINIPEKFQLKLPIHHDTFLIDGKIGNWNGEFTEVVSTLFSNSENDKYGNKIWYEQRAWHNSLWGK